MTGQILMDRAPLSIVIPTLNSASSLAKAVEPLVPAVSQGLVKELIVSDGGSCDDIASMADALGARLLVGPPGRGIQLAAGAAAAKGEWLLFLHADSILDPQWIGAVSRHLKNSSGAGCFRLRFGAAGLAAAWVAGWANRRTVWFGLPFGDQGLLIPRKLYSQIGGYPAIPIMEDVAIARRLRGRIGMLDAAATTDAARYIQQGWLRRGAANLVLQVKYFSGVPPEKLARRYRRDRRVNP